MTTLTAVDRCDRCAAAAVYRVRKADLLLELDFCGHHFRDNAADLYADGWVVTQSALAAPELEGAPS
ncbi:DUF7455 domain-containing protein [Streptomyces microflavus]|uniref:DUF7455 domain-containing protein n=1 Tax=Streptomyces microflavus TaxID=1919 RepID=UPI0036B5A355